MNIDRELIHGLARLARLELTPAEEEVYAHDLANLLGYFEKINSLDTGELPELARPIELSNRFRADEPAPSLPASQALAPAPAEEEGFFKVPRGPAGA